MTLKINSPLSQGAINIFTHMTRLSIESEAVNLGQGFPDFDGASELKDLVCAAIHEGLNQYPPMPGIPALREAIGAKVATEYGCSYDVVSEITVVPGASFGVFGALQTVAGAGDEVILLDPSFDIYRASITMLGAVPVVVSLDPSTFHPDFEAIKSAITEKTKAIIINTPHNPSGTTWSATEMMELSKLLKPTNIAVISDEVYEHMVFDGAAHQSVARFPDLVERSFVIGSFGKTFHMTGWKVGYVLAPKELTQAFRNLYQYSMFCTTHPHQVGIAAYMRNPQTYRELPEFFQQKRDFFRAGLAKTPFKLLPCQGTYFQCVDYSAIKTCDDLAFSDWLCREIGVTSIPLSPFYREAPQGQKIIRLCFGKKQETLEKALQRLQKL